MKIIAFYLPQFYPIPENDQNWGKDFTEWNHLLNPKCNIPIRHPHPDIGYYNILDYQTRKKQAEIAKIYGVYGFCYYHHWTRAWDGSANDIIIKQEYGGYNEKEKQLIYLEKFFKHPNYIRINGKPLFVVWRVCDLGLARINFWKEKLFLTSIIFNFNDLAFGDATIEWQPFYTTSFLTNLEWPDSPIDAEEIYEKIPDAPKRHCRQFCWLE